MYVNKCTKCGKEFETKNPKRVICPECLYADRASEPQQQKEENYNSYSSYDSTQEAQERPQRSYTQGGYDRNDRYQNYSQGGYDRNQGGYTQNRGGYGDRRPQQRYGGGGGYDRNQGGYSQNRGSYGDRRPQQRYGGGGGYDRNQGGYSQRGGYGDRRPQQRYGGGGGYDRNQNRGGFNNRRPGGFRPKPNRAPKPQKTLLVNREQLEQIELLYKQMLPLPNPDAHEVIGEKIGLEPRKVFFGINLVRQKMMLPKLPFPKRKLAISPDQMQAIQSLYEPLLPLPPIGCHKIIAAQLKMDEWRVHVGIGLIRAKLGLERWNSERPDAPEEFKTKPEEKTSKSKKKNTENDEVLTENTEKPKKTVRKKKSEETSEDAEEKPKKTSRKKKADEE